MVASRFPRGSKGPALFESELCTVLNMPRTQKLAADRTSLGSSHVRPKWLYLDVFGGLLKMITFGVVSLRG